ncbi:MAG: metal-dependent hydrolase [Fusobacteriota bacterium]
MTTPTHAIFSILIAVYFSLTSKWVLAYMIIGSLLPDIDHPRSFIGRVFFFISNPLQKKFGHRTITHSLLLWVPVMVLGYFFSPLIWFSLGAMSHIFLDMWNVGGVPILYPLDHRIYVMANRGFRIRSGKKKEFILLLFFLVFAGLGYKLDQLGGFRGALREMIGDYNSAIASYEKAGTKVCYLEGKLRYTSGQIEKNEWLIVGKNKSWSSLTLYDEEEKRLINVPNDGKMLRANLRPTESNWNVISFEKTVDLKNNPKLIFYKVNKYWHQAKKGDILLGDVKYLGRCVID